MDGHGAEHKWDKSHLSMGHIPFPSRSALWDKSHMELDRFIRRVAQIIEERGIEQKALSLEIGKSATYVRDLLEGRSKKPRMDGLVALAVKLDLDPVEALSIPRLGGGIPVVGRVGAGEEVFPIDDHEKGAGDDEIQPPLPIDGDAVAVVVEGLSMYPAYKPGDALVYQRDGYDDWHRYIGQDVVVKLADGRTFVKVLKRATKTTATLGSHNAPDIENVRVEWAAPVLWVRRSQRMTAGRMIPVKTK